MRISVCMATFNGERFVGEQIESILKQLTIEDELIISDDDSTDNTVDIVRSFNDNRIKIFKNSNSRGVLNNFENALNKSCGKYIFLVDQDDIWVDGKVRRMLELLNDHDLVLSDAIVVNDAGDVVYDSFYKLNKSKKGFVNNFIKNSYLGCAMAFNRNILELSIPFPKKIPMHDWWIGLVAETHGSVIHIDNKLILHRRHGNNASSTSEVSKFNLQTKFFFRFVLVKELAVRFLVRRFKSNL